MVTTKFAAAALSVAVGTGLQISGLGGPVARAVVWAIAALLAIFLAIQHLRGRSRSRGSDVGHQAWQMGHDLIDFVRTRHASAPRRAGKQRPIHWMVHFGSARDYDADTVSLFRERFGDPLLEIVHELRGSGLVGAVEARMLTAPSTPAAIERLGHRLIELGSQVKA